jgi:hypothetical protein
MKHSHEAAEQESCQVRYRPQAPLIDPIPSPRTDLSLRQKFLFTVRKHAGAIMEV